MSKNVVTRFAPSPTGFLHIGSARTALFSWLYARRHNGKFYLRIEDTDRERSTSEAIDAIISGMEWLGLSYDEEIIYQFSRANRHKEVAEELLKNGNAFKCYCSKEELDEKRQKAIDAKQTYKYDGKCRNEKDSDHVGETYSVRLKAPSDGVISVDDIVQGKVTVKHEQLDDMILLRSDATPTYMLAVVVDDHDMGVTHIIRGDDHLVNATRQILIYQAMGWDIPAFAHIPLIHAPDGSKLSKRHGALGVDAYKDMGYLPEAMNNYLLRLGWSHGDDEIISRDQAIEWFDLEHIGKSPSRFDFAKLDHVNAHYIKESSNDKLIAIINPILNKTLGRTIEEVELNRISKGLDGLKQRVKNVNELANNSIFYLNSEPIKLNEEAVKILDDSGKKIISHAIEKLQDTDNYIKDNIEMIFTNLSSELDTKLGKIMSPIRAAITGSNMSPSMFEVIEILGKEETLKRLKRVL